MAAGRKRVVLGVLGCLALLFVGAIVMFVFTVAPLGTRYVAKRICSGVFVAGRAPESVWVGELHDGNFGYPPRFSWEVDREAQAVTARWNGLASQTVRFRLGLGCTPDSHAQNEMIPAEGLTAEQLASYQEPWPWPEETHSEGPLDEVLASAFDDPAAGTRAVVIVQDGKLVGERYADGFDRDTPLHGWSMNKSILHALIGTQVLAGHMSLGQNHLFDEWEGTPRSEVTLEQMLQMAPGLEWSEEYTNPFDDTIQMLFGADEAARGALEKPLAYPPGSHWNYSSGTSNMLSLLLRRALAEEGEDYLGYPQRALFSPLGMKTSVLEPDATGTFVASSFGFASALDWARFGQLYLDDGLVLGERVLPAGWLEQACTPTPESGGQYGGHFWLRVGEDALTRPSPLPDDACHAAGHEGQFVTIVPSERTVIVRLGLTPDRSAWHQEDFAKSVLDALSADRG